MDQRFTKTLPDPEVDQLSETVQEPKPLQESELDRSTQTARDSRPLQEFPKCELDTPLKLQQELPDHGEDRLPKTLQELPDSELDKPCTDLDLACIASDIIEWERIAPHLGISDAEGEEIRHESKSYHHQKHSTLRKWRNKHGSTATYRNLIQIFSKLEKQNIAIVQTKSELDRPCSDSELAVLANKLMEWERLAPKIGITKAVQNEIRHDSASYWHQKYLALRKWKELHGSRATMRKLVQMLSELEEQSTAENILTLHDQNALDTFHMHLKQCYQQHQPPSCGHWPITEHPVYVEPTLVKVRKNPEIFRDLLKESEGYLPNEVHLSDIFKQGLPSTLLSYMRMGECSYCLAHISGEEISTFDIVKGMETGAISLGGIPPGKPKFVLIEGPAGAGKSTLIWHASQEWAKGNLFQELNLLIIVSLADPAVREASSLADLIPHPDRKIREAVASYIAQSGGDRVGIFFDGVDLIPPQELNHHYITKVLRGSPGIALPNASILVTSRPEGSKHLLSYFTSNIRLIGFSKKQIATFFSMITMTNPSTVENFLQIAVENPSILGLCNLPINAAIIAFLLSVLDQPLPTRRTELFKYFLLNLLLRHIQERTEYGNSVDCLEEFEDLKEVQEVALAFQQLCHLAWSGILECKTILSRQDVRKVGINPQKLNGLSLLQHKPSLSAIGWSAQYTFLHQSVQEFLAAVHISTLSPSEQTSAALQLIQRNPIALVLPFLVGITKNSSIVQILCEEYEKNYSIEEVLRYSSQTTTFRGGETTLQLFSCMYESQSADCCAVLTVFLRSAQKESTGPVLVFPKFIDPSAYAYFGYYLANCFVETEVGCDVWFLYTSNGNLGVELMIKEFVRTRSTQDELMSTFVTKPLPSTSQVDEDSTYMFLKLCLLDCGLTHTGTATICHGMSSLQPVLIMELNLEGNWHPNTTDIGAALKVVVETLASYPHLLSLTLAANNITSKHTWHLILMLCFSNLKCLNIAYNEVGLGIPLLASALRYNRKLTYLNLEECQLTSQDLLSLGCNLAHNDTLDTLQISRNLYSTSTFTTFLKLLEHSKIKQIFTSDLTSEHIDVINIVNRSRFQANLPQLRVGEKHPSFIAYQFYR